MIGEQLFRGHLVHDARLRVGPFLSADGVLVENLGVFSQRPASPRPLSHDAREVTPTPMSTSPSLPQASTRTTASCWSRMVFLVQHEHARDPLHDSELDHRGDVLNGFLPLDIAGPIVVIRPQREADARELVHVAGSIAPLGLSCMDFPA